MERELTWPGGTRARVFVVPAADVDFRGFEAAVAQLVLALDSAVDTSTVVAHVNDRLALDGLEIRDVGMTAQAWYVEVVRS